MIKFENELKNREEQFLKLYPLLLCNYEVELIAYKNKANYWEAEFRQLKSKEEELNNEIEELKAKLNKREHQLFGNKSERKTSTKPDQIKPPIKRGQQKGSIGHSRRTYDELPVVEKTIDLIESEKHCPHCNLEYQPINATEDSEVLEVINVKPYKRVIKRKKYKRYCECKGLPRIITAPAIGRPLPKSKIGVSIWSSLLLQKYEYQQPVYRALKQWESNGLPLAIGTIIDGFKKLIPLLTPIYDEIVAHNISARHWHADETGWKVFETIEGKRSSRWYLWIFANKESVVYRLDPSRSSKVLDKHFKESAEGTLSVDRYSAYKAIAKTGVFILAFCWAHVRRDFISYAKAYPNMEDWALNWINQISKLYEINNNRLESVKKYQKNYDLLKKQIKSMNQLLDQQLADETLRISAKKILISLKKHWSGLTVFVECPEIPMDNNTAERGLRNSVVGRKNYYGSFSVWSGELAAIMFTIFETVKRWKLNPHTWLISYLQVCADLGGKPPDSVNAFLPWNMTEQQKILFAKHPVGEDSS